MDKLPNLRPQKNNPTLHEWLQAFQGRIPMSLTVTAAEEYPKRTFVGGEEAFRIAIERRPAIVDLVVEVAHPDAIYDLARFLFLGYFPQYIATTADGFVLFRLQKIPPSPS